MSENEQRIWTPTNHNEIAQRRAADVIESYGLAWPCRVLSVSGSLVTVAFEVVIPGVALPVVTMPKAEGQWIRSPTQVGDLGLAIPADTYLGGVSGLGGGVADTSRRGNLSTLVWVPVANTGFPGVNVNAAYVSGPEGAVIRDTAGKAIVTISNDGTITITAAQSVVINAPLIALNGDVTQTAGTGTGNVTMIGPMTVTNNVTANGISLDSHVHSGVQSGGSDTGPPV